MKMMKKSSIAVWLLLGFVSNGYTMDAPEAPQVNYVTGTRNLLADVQGVIILQLIKGSNTIEKAVGNILKLAYDNTKLINKIKEPFFCLQLIKTLAKRFGRSDASAAQALGTKEAIRRLGIQEAFVNLCEKDNVSEIELEKLYNQGVDLLFTTRYVTTDRRAHRVVPIFYALRAGNISAVKFLLDKGVDINNVDGRGTKAFDIIFFEPCKNQVTMVKMLLERPDLIINKRGDGEFTALALAIRNFLRDEINKYINNPINDLMYEQRTNENKEIIKLLLEAGADPEDELVQDRFRDIQDEEVVAMIKNAIAKKRGGKNAPQVNYATGTKNLSGDVQGVIILQLIKASDTIEKAVENIKKLARDNTELINKINESDFCLQIIKTLAKRFGRSDESAAQALWTKEAIRRLGIQAEFITLCANNNVSESELEELYNQGVDLLFTTKYVATDGRAHRVVPIFYALRAGNISALKFLLDKGIDINNVDGGGATAFDYIFGEPCENKVTMVKMLLERPDLSINKISGSTKITPLAWAIYNFLRDEIKFNNPMYKQQANECKEVIKLLLEAGADPEDKRVQGCLPKIKDEEVVAMIKNAVAKKHAKK